VREFIEMCLRHPYPGVRRPRYDSTEEFLERCCEIGLLMRRKDLPFAGVRYYPTKALDEWASWFT
jgi:hypothetical protein